MMKNIFEIFFLIVFFDLNSVNTEQSLSSSFVKTLPKFSQESITRAENIVLYENAPLNTEILSVQATTYSAALPIIYSLIDAEPYFKINSSTGVIKLFSPIDKITKLQFTIVAQDSATFPDQQSSFLTVNVIIISSSNYPPAFNDEIPYFVSVLDIITPGSVIYNNIYITDKNAGQNGFPMVFCDNNSIENSESKTSCEYFKIDTQMIEVGLYRCVIRLIKKLDYNIKKNFIMSIVAQISWLKSTSYLVVEVKKPENIVPRFLNSSYLLVVPPNPLITNVLEVTVINVNLTTLSKITFQLIDSKNIFKIADTPARCYENFCSQFIQLNTTTNQISQYDMNVTFIQQLGNSVLAASAVVFVVIERPKESQTPPKFINLPYEFYISENIPFNSLVRNVSITVHESDNLSAYNSGFILELLNKDFSLSNDIFEIVPNYGLGLLEATLKLNPNAELDYEKGKRKYEFIIKATSRSSRNLISYANLTIYLQDYNEYSPYFDTAINARFLNQPESFNIDDIITRVYAFDLDGDDSSLVYSIIGPHQDRFKINSLGQISLLKRFDLSKDNFIFYNITVLATDQGGLSNYTNLILYLNSTNSFGVKDVLFECASSGLRSELNQFDCMTLAPELYIPVNSIYPLKYVLYESYPIINELVVHQNTGKVYLKSPLNSTVLFNYDKISLNVKVYQIQSEISDSIFLSSITCSAIIYLKDFNRINFNLMKPYFLRQYSIVVDRESVSRSVALIKVEAISMNPNNIIPILYTIVNNVEQYFYIDSTQGFIYPQNDLGLEPKIYEIKVQATDKLANTFSVTNVLISIVQNTNTKIVCDTDYLVLKINPEKLNETNSMTTLGQINCVSNSKFNDSQIYYDITPPIAIYDCDGYSSSFMPNIGINFKNGKIVTFGALSRNNFCDSSFHIIVRKDDTTVIIPLKLILIEQVENKPPKFVSPPFNITYLSNYAHIGSYITTVVAYDSITNQLIEKYAIESERAIPNTGKKYFKIDSLTGVITLNNLPFVDQVDLIVSATSNQRVTSYTQISIDLSSYFLNFYSNIIFESLPPERILIYNDKFYYDPIYKANANCLTRYDLSKIVPCGLLDFSINYFQNNDTNFIIDKNTANIYLATSKISNPSYQPSYLLIINATSHLSTYPDRFYRSIQKNLTIFVDSSKNDISTFEYDNYNIQILDNTPKDTIILTIKYKTQIKDSIIRFSIEQRSNFQVEDYFYITYSKMFQAFYLFVKSSPLPIDKPEVNFLLRVINEYQNTSSLSFTKINIKILSSAFQSSSMIPSFITPNKANYLIVLNPANFGLINNTIIFELQTNASNNQFIAYRIINNFSLPFYIDRNFIRIYYPIPDYVDSKKNSYLLFIEAQDLLNPSIDATYTTLDIRVNNFLQSVPYFLREPSSGPVSIVLNETVQLNSSLFDLTPYIFVPSSNVYFYVFDKNNNSQISNTFFVNPNKTSLQLKKSLTVTSEDFYKLIIYITDKPTFSNQLYNASTNDTTLLFVNVKIANLSANIPSFVDSTSNIYVEEIVPIDNKIGFVLANGTDEIKYSLETCEFVSKAVIYRDPQFCDLFKIDSSTGVIFTNNSNYGPFVNNYFVLKISASLIKNTVLKAFNDITIYITNYQEKSRLVIASLSPLQNNTLIELKNQINNELTSKYRGDFIFEYHDFSTPFIGSLTSELDACFYLTKTSDKEILNYKDTISILSDSNGIKSVFDKFYVSNIERCFNREEKERQAGTLYTKSGEWPLNSISIGFIALAAVCLVLTLLAICILNICWASHMRQSTFSPNIESDTVETDSNNFLIDD